MLSIEETQDFIKSIKFNCALSYQLFSETETWNRKNNNYNNFAASDEG